MRRIALVLSLVTLASVVGCASNEKLGDRAAAVGDWKSAERQYAAALQSEPNNPEKRAKYQQARQQALQGAVAAARACQASKDWECVFAESDYAAQLEPGNAEYATMRAEAGRQAGYLRVRKAVEAGQRRDHRAAFQLLAQAREASQDPGLHAEVARATPAIVKGAVHDAMQLRGQQQYPAAIDLLTLAANVDGGVRPTLDQVRAEYDRWLDAQYEAAAQQGDGLLRERRFAEAQAQYEAALKFKKGGRAEALARYARDLAQGDAAVQRREWPKATAAYDDAVRSGMDAGGYAASQLERVRIRPYAIRLRTVLVKPFRPDGAPWAGGRSRGFERLVGMLASSALDGGRDPRRTLEMWDMLPHENKPNLFAIITLPDGRQLVTVPQRAIRARFESTVVVGTNSFDDRPVSLRIVHAGDAGQPNVEVGAVTFRMSELLAGELGLRDRSIVELKVIGEATPLAEGSLQGFAPPAPAQPAAAPAPPPPRR